MHSIVLGDRKIFNQLKSKNKVRKLFRNIPLLLVGLATNAQPVLKTMMRLPDTGQTASYTNTFGEDADYNSNTPFFILNGNGTVTDTITSLMWQNTDGGEMTIENALLYCDTLTLGGSTDWRLPNCHELFSILNHDKVNPAIDTNYFTRTLADYWWSNQRQANDSTKVWVTNAGGGVGNHPKTETISAGGIKRFHVRAVRDVDAPSIIPNHFINNGDGTTTDIVTALTWQQIPSSDSITWEQALSLADTLTFAGFTDWRMPNIKELQSISDESLISPSVSQTYFSGVNVNHYWSSTSLPNQVTKAWYLDTHFGITTYEFKTNKLYLLSVRGGNFSTGINENLVAQNSISIFPNPTTGILNIENKSTIDEIRISNMFGQGIYSAYPNSKSLSINLNTNGIYFVTVIEGKSITTKCIVVTVE